MAGEWRRFSLGDLCSLITDGKHGDCQNETGSGYYFLSVKDVFDNCLVYENARQIMELDFLETHRRTNLEPGDILFTNTGTIGRMAIAPDNPRTRRTTFQKSAAILKPRRNLVAPHFLYYTLRFDNARLSELAAGTTQKNLLLKDFRSFEVRIPGLEEQRAIAHILGTLDDKIELNRRMSETLEAMARALFKSWFVDFDPVRAKAEGRLPALPAGRQATPTWPRAGAWCVYALECEDDSVYIGHTENLQRRFEEHLKGRGSDWTKRHPPKRVAYWEEVPTQSEAIERERKLKSGSGREWLKLEIARPDALTGALPQPPYLPDRQVADLFPARLVDSELGEIPEGWELGPLQSALVLQRGFDLPTNERTAGEYPVLAASGPNGTHDQYMVRGPGVTTGRSGVLGKVFYVAEDFWPLNTSLWVREFRRAKPAYAFYLLSRLDFAQFNAGSAVPTLNRNHVHSMSTLLPPATLVGGFERFATDCLQRQAKLDRECATLAALRDAILPKLVSGELRVNDAEKIIEVNA